MSLSKIDFSAQFGGRDAAAIVLPHFKALKNAAKNLQFEGFPFAELAFILRVDGEVHSYGLSGAGYVEIDKDGEYLSVDIGIRHEDREHITDAVSTAIISSIEEIKAIENLRGPWNIDYTAIQQCLNELTARYRKETLYCADSSS